MQEIIKCNDCKIFPVSSLKNIIDIDSGSENFLDKSVLNFESGEVLYNEGDKLKGIYCIYSGNVKVVKKSKTYRESIIYIAKPGDTLGIHFVMTDKTYLNTAIALVDTIACYISKESITKLLEKDKKSILALMKLQTQKIDILEAQIYNKPTKSSISKILQKIFLIFKKHANTDGELNIALKDLAIYCQTSTNNLNKILCELISKKIISLSYSNIKVLDYNALENIAKA